MGGWAGSAAYLLGIGWFFGVAILVGVVLGRWADSTTGLEPVFTVAGIVLGLLVALVGGFRMLMRFMQRFGDESPGRSTR